MTDDKKSPTEEAPRHKSMDESETTNSPSLESYINDNNVTNRAKTATQAAASSAPINIRQDLSGKFGVFCAGPRLSPDHRTATSEPVPIEKIIKTTNTMSNMLMAHKIALEDDFRLEPGMDISGPLMSLSPIIGSSPQRNSPPGSSKTGDPNLHSRVKDMVHEAYWNLFKEELDTQTNEDVEQRKHELSRQLLCDIRLKIVELLLPQHTRLKQDIEDKLDPKILDQLIKVGSLNLRDYAKYVLSVLSELCAPVRDDMLRTLSNNKDVVQLYRGIMELLELMKLDYANFTLNQFKPHIKAHSQDYEREKFDELLKQQQIIGIDGLEYTKVWLERAVNRVDTVYSIAELIDEPYSSNIQHNTPLEQTTSTTACRSSLDDKISNSGVVNKVLNSAYCELLEWTPSLQKLYPETLLFDEATFHQLSGQYNILLLTSSVLLTTFAFANRFRAVDDDFKSQVKSHVITLLTSSYDNQSTTTKASDEPARQIKKLDNIDQLKLETVAAKLCDDIRQMLQKHGDQLASFENQRGLIRAQILDLESENSRVKQLAKRRIMEFIETLLVLDVEHQQNKFKKAPPPVNIPLGLNCMTDEITLTMVQLIKLVRYNRQVFFHHYQEIISKFVTKIIKDCEK